MICIPENIDELAIQDARLQLGLALDRRDEAALAQWAVNWGAALCERAEDAASLEAEKGW